MLRIMIDLETLDTHPTAAMIAIGIVIKKESDLQDCRMWNVDPDLVQGTTNPETLKWWKNQDPRVFQEVWKGNQTQKEVIQSVQSYLKSTLEKHVEEHPRSSVRLYADPAAFDFPILRHQFKLAGIEPPWSWRDERCLRTMKKELEDDGMWIPSFANEYAHHPVYDCLEQFRELEHILEFRKEPLRFGGGR